MSITTDGTDESTLGGPHEDTQVEGAVENVSDLVDLPIESVDVSLESRPPRPTINPIKNISGSPYSGAGTGVSGAYVFIYVAGTPSGIVGGGPVKSGSWSGAITFPVNVNKSSIEALQRLDGQDSERTAPMEIYRAILTFPKSDTTEPAKGLIFRGIGAPKSKVLIVKSPPNHNEVLSAEATIDDQGNWQAPLTANLPNGSVSISALVSYVGTTSIYTLPVVFSVNRPPPIVVTNPSANSSQNQTFNLSGTGGIAGSTMQVFIDLTQSKVGEAAVTGDGWTVAVSVGPGPVSLVGRQITDNIPSDRGIPRAFKIRPSEVSAVSYSVLPDGQVEISGKGYTGATVVVTAPDSVTPPPSVVVSAGEWTTTATGWPYGTYKLQIVQKVSDNANGWIESQPFPLEVEKKLPNVRELKYTRDYQPTFSGLGNKGATVWLWKIDADEAVAPHVPLTADGSWLSQASEVWGPTLNRRVRIKQAGFSQETDWVFLDVTIPPQAPGLSDPDENGLSPVFSGTCWPGAQVTLTFSDSDQSYHATVTDGFWTFQRPTDFTAGVEHTVRVIQTAASQPSAPTERFFSVYPTMIQPVITEPGNDDDVDHAFTLKGHGAMKGAMLQVFDRVHNSPLSDPLLQTVDGDWAIDIRDLTLRSYGIGIRQTSHNRVIESERLDVNVVVLPPRITCPVEDGTLPRGDFLQGEGRAGAKVDILKGDEPWLMDIPVGLDGLWSRKVELPVGSTTLRARQTFVENDKPFPSEYADERQFSVVPAAPFIETPVAGEHIGRQVVVSGFGVPGDTVSVTLDSECASASVLEDRTWSVRLTLTQTGGEHVLQATAALGEFESDAATRLVLLGTYEPGIETPASGHRVSNPLLCAGTGRPGVVQGVSWYNPEETVLQGVAVSGGRWSGQAAQALREGGQWLRFMQTLEGGEEGQLSAWVDSQRFEVEPDALSKTQSKKSDERF